MRGLRRLAEQVGFGADGGSERHHNRFADRIDRRVRNLREELLEVGEKRRRTVRHHCQRCVVAHRTDRLLAGLRHRRDQHLQILFAVTEGLATDVAWQDAGHRYVRCFEVVEVNAVIGEPLLVRPRARNFLLDLLVFDDPALLEVNEENLAWLKPPEALYVLRLDCKHSRLRAEHHEAVLGLNPAARAQPIAVERRANNAAVCEADRSWPVPRLHQAGVEGVEALQCRREVGAVTVSLGDHHHRRVRQRAAGEH